MREHGILTQAWSPIGGITFYRDGKHGSTLDDPIIADIASAHGKSSSPSDAALGPPAWPLGHSEVHQARAVSRRTSTCFDFDLTADEMAAIDALDTGHRGGPEPDAITLEAFGRPIPEA